MGIMYTKQEMRQEHHRRDKCMNLIDDFYTVYVRCVCVCVVTSVREIQDFFSELILLVKSIT